MNREKLERVVNRIHSLIEGLEELRSMQEPEENKGCESKHACDGSCCRKEHVARSESPEAHEMPAPTRIKVKRGVAAIEALKVINGERQDTYGNPEDCFAAIAVFWSVYRNEHFSDIDVAVMMALLKIARMKNNGINHRDNFVDAIGYLALAADMAEKSKSDNALSSAD